MSERSENVQVTSKDAADRSKPRSEWRDPWLRASVVVYIAYSVAVLAGALHYIWTHR